MGMTRRSISGSLRPAVWFAAVLSVWLLLGSSSSTLSWPQLEGSARGFPVLRDLNGRHLADGDFLQWVSGGRLYVNLTYAFGRGRRVEEKTVFRQRPELAQETWS